ncbi:MAG TPA: glutaminase, partial [Verrucomicrobiae bacterium]
IQMLYDKATWAKYTKRDKTKAANWAAMPVPPKVTVIVPAADHKPAQWNYTTAQPGDQWMQPAFNDSNWKRGWSGFGSAGTPGTFIGTSWNTGDIWLRRTVEINAKNVDKLEAWMHHDEDAEVYINGVLAVRASEYISAYDTFPLTAEGRAALKPGKNVIAIHCHQTGGGQYVDLGFVETQAN